MSDLASMFGGTEFISSLRRSLKIIETKNKKIKRKLKKHITLYHAVNAMLAQLEDEGQIHKSEAIVEELYNALHDIDGGVYNEKI